MDFLNKLKNLDLGSLGNLIGKKGDNTQASTEPRVIKEINLVPDIKNDFIKTLKFRNLVFFLCIVVAISSTVVILVFLTIAGGQQGFINAKQNTINALEKKISDYSDLSDFLTIRDQLGNIAAITEQKKATSRIFNIISALIPTGGADYIGISNMTLNLSEELEVPTLTIEAHADSGTAPFIDYIVLDSFKKSMDYMRYDYGEYVDRNDQTIPAYCIIDKATDGSVLYDTTRGYYAYWLIEGEGCKPSMETEEETEEEKTTPTNSSTSIWDQIFNEGTTGTETETQTTDVQQIDGYNVVDYEGQKVVQIWRTPQYNDWYKSEPRDNEPYMTLDGEIHNVEHFNSACIKYSGTEDEKDQNKINWSTTNDTCLLVPTPGEDAQSTEQSGGGDEDEGEDEYGEDEEIEVTSGIRITGSRNARNDDSGELVLSFEATIALAPEVFNFNNHHMLAIPPSGRRNVTDSYIQIQSIFAKPAKECSKDDIECSTTPTSSSSNSSDNSNNKDEEDDTERIKDKDTEEDEE